jgi:hypothetical protein
MVCERLEQLGQVFLHDLAHFHFFVVLACKKEKRSALFIQPGALCMLAMLTPTDA